MNRNADKSQAQTPTCRSLTYLFFRHVYDRFNCFSSGISFLEIAWPNGAKTWQSVIPHGKDGIPVSTDVRSSRAVPRGETGGRTDVEASSASIHVCGARLILCISFVRLCKSYDPLHDDVSWLPMNGMSHDTVYKFLFSMENGGMSTMLSKARYSVCASDIVITK